MCDVGHNCLTNSIGENRMDALHERLIVRAATIDELLSDDFEVLPGQKGDADLAARRLAAWCRSCASGDWLLFSRRLKRDGLSLNDVLARFATVRRRACASMPAWIDDAIWIEVALQSPSKDVKPVAAPHYGEPYAFGHLLAAVVEQAEARLWASVDGRAVENLNESARGCLSHSLLKELSGLCAPAIYERFVKANDNATPATAAQPQQEGSTWRYDRFVTEMKSGGFRHLFADKPVLLRLIASITRQWIDRSRELVTRLEADLTTIRRDLLNSSTHSRIAGIEGGLSDRHNGGRSVHIISFEDGGRVVYKPKDLRIDATWHALVERLNRADPPVQLKAVRTAARDGYGWTEFVAHSGCVDQEGSKRFFRRAGAWLALFHCFAAVDMHQENMIAAGDHPVPVDLEMILQATPEEKITHNLGGEAFAIAMKTIANSVSMVGLLPAYGRTPDNDIFVIGGMIPNQSSNRNLRWSNINSDAMRPQKSTQVDDTIPNLPHVDGRYARLGDHIDDFISGFDDYASFLLRQSKDATQCELFDGFAGLPLRKIIRSTRFYAMLLQRLKDHRTMEDGVTWSAQADFIARLADWDTDSDPAWPLQRAERSALVQLNVPHFVSPNDGHTVHDATGISIHTEEIPGLDRARARMQSLNVQDIAWQIEVIRQNTDSVSRSAERRSATLAIGDSDMRRHLRLEVSGATRREVFVAEADKIARELSDRAIWSGPGAAWIGIDWLGDSEVSQLVDLGPDLYNGNSGIAVFLAAHSATAGCNSSKELALGGIARLRKNLRSRSSARVARLLGTGGAIGLGSIVYTLAIMSKCLNADELLADAHMAAELFTDDLIAADKKLDIIGGCAGGILGLLRLYRDGKSNDVLKRATRCGEHLLGQRRNGPQGRRSWSGQGSGPQALNGMSHGAAGFAYALASLSAATEREDFAKAAAECLAFENSSYDAERSNWPDLRNTAEPAWPYQWCHGAVGIGLVRIAMMKRGGLDRSILTTDIRNALMGSERAWPSNVDTLCCGTLGSIEFLCEAGPILGRADLGELAARRLAAVLETAESTGDFRWNAGNRRFNLGLFRGLAGVGYTLLRRLDDSLPNVLIWD
jgi:type 2 lantibiotic biosynthesis protein LanM